LCELYIFLFVLFVYSRIVETNHITKVFVQIP